MDKRLISVLVIEAVLISIFTRASVICLQSAPYMLIKGPEFDINILHSMLAAPLVLPGLITYLFMQNISYPGTYLCIIASALAMPESARQRRDVMDSVKDASDSAAKTLSDAGDAVVNVFKPTEKSTIDKLADGVKNLGS